MIYTHFSTNYIKYVKKKENSLQTISNIIYKYFKFNKITVLFSGIGKNNLHQCIITLLDIYEVKWNTFFEPVMALIW